MARDAPSPEPMVYSFIYIRQSPQLRNPPTKTYGHRSRSPTRAKDLHTMGCGLIHQGDHLRPCYRYPSAMHLALRYLPPWLGWTRAPLASACGSNPHQGSPSTPVTASHVTRIHTTLRYGRGVGFMGGLFLLNFSLCFFHSGLNFFSKFSLSLPLSVFRSAFLVHFFFIIRKE